MKKWIWCFTISCLCNGVLIAQTPSKKKGSGKRSQVVSKTKSRAVTDTSFSFLNTSSNEALSNGTLPALTIADPTIRTFNTRVFSNTVPDDEKAIIGIPKIRTGVGRGRVLFYPTTSATSGTNTGSGLVGTGSSLGNVGTNGVGMGVNGKNPYAGPAIYGTRVISDLRPNSTLAKPVIRQ